jgi:hypothetical protein
MASICAARTGMFPVPSLFALDDANPILTLFDLLSTYRRVEAVVSSEFIAFERKRQ